MPLTLADYARLAPSPLKAGVVDILRMTSPIMDAMTWEDEGKLDLEILRQNTLPSIASRKIGANFTESKGTIDSVKERIVNFGGYVDIDKAIFKAKSIVDQKSLQVGMFTKAMAAYFNNIFITGQPSSDYDSLTGLWYRISNYLPASQAIQAAGAGLDVTLSGISAANVISLIDRINELCDVVGRPNGPDYLIMNRNMKLRLEATLRQSLMLDVTTDRFGRKFSTFGTGGPKIIDIGPTNPLDLTTLIITNTETAAGALTTGALTSIYAVKLGDEFLNGFQEYPLDVNDVGWLDSGVTYRVTIDWTPGIYTVSPFAVGRLYAIKAV